MNDEAGSALSAAEAPPPVGLWRLLAIGPALVLIRLYRVTLSPFVGRACRFEPTCSRYAEQALRRHGLLRGGALAAWRILRCQPWGGYGWDPVPVPWRWPGFRAGMATMATASRGGESAEAAPAGDRQQGDEPPDGVGHGHG